MAKPEEPKTLHQTKYRWYNINLDILPAKIAYFFDTARRVGSLTSLVLFLTGIGLDKVEAGIILGFRLIGMLIAGPFWGVIADKFHCHRLILIINCIGIILTMGCQPFLSIQYGDSQKNKCPEPFQGVKLSLINGTNQTVVLQSLGTINKEQYGASFFVFFFIQILATFFEGSSTSFIDVATIRKSELSKHRKIDYGRQRFWGSFGAIAGVNITNLCIEYFPRANVTCYSGLFLTYMIFTIWMTIALLVLYKGLSFDSEENIEGGENHEQNRNSPVNQATELDEMNSQRDKNKVSEKIQEEDTNKKKESSIPSTKQCFRRVFKKHLFQAEVFFFYLVAFAGGIIHSPYKVFMFLYLKELGASSMIMTIAVTISSISAIFGFFFSAKIIRLFGGSLQSISAGLIFYVVRFVGYSLSPNGWIILIFQPLDMITFVLFVTSAVTYVKETSPLIVITSMVSIFQTMFEGVGILVGSSIAGVIFKSYGGRKLFLIYALFALFWGIALGCYICLVKQKFFSKTKRKQ